MADETMVLIETKTIGAGGSATLEFTGIPNTFTDIQVVISARSSSGLGTGNVAFNLAINGSTADKTFRRLYGGGGSAGSDTPSTSARAGSAIPTSTATASTFGNVAYYFPNYASTTTYKSISLDGVTENNSSTVYEIDMAALLWSSNSAITSLSFTLSDGSNFVQYSSASLYGIKKGGTGTITPVAPKATGGTIVYSGGYFYHTFTSSGTFTPTESLSADILTIAGGAGGGRWGSGSGGGGGGGGAGGLVYSASQSLTTTGYTVTVGAGGGAQANGSNSVFSGQTTAVGGGRGASNTSYVANSGGSGGGGSNGPIYIEARNGAAGTSGQGNAGGNATTSSYYAGGGGGGGAGAVGVAGGGEGGNGGAGGAGTNTYSTWATATGTGASGYYAGGGGAGSWYTGGAGGVGGGGAGGGWNGAYGTYAATDGTANTGSGGGGNANYNGNIGTTAAGGSGIVIVRYAA